MSKLFHLTPKQRGFTLAEMAIVVVIAGIMVTMGLKMTMANLTNAAYSSTVSKQAQIKIALINYLRTAGKLPCPDMTVVPNPPSGVAAGGCAGGPALAYGVLPWRTLNISRDTAIDGWGNFFVYRVQNQVVGANRNWTSNVGATAFDVGQLKSPSLAGITVNQRDPVTGVTPITTSAVVVILSGGNNGYGMRTQQGRLNAAVPGGHADETVNTTPGGNTFIVGPYTDIVGSLSGPFDDVVSFMVPQDLLQPLVAEQLISSCASYCKACTNLNVPWVGCVAANNPVIPPSGCNVVAPSNIPVGNPTPSNCP